MNTQTYSITTQTWRKPLTARNADWYPVTKFYAEVIDDITGKVVAVTGKCASRIAAKYAAEKKIDALIASQVR